MDNPFNIVVEQLQMLGRNFLAQLPAIGLALVVFVLFLLLSKIASTAVQRSLIRYDRDLRGMIGRLAAAAVVVLGVLVALWIAIPTVRFTEILTSLGVSGLIIGLAVRDLLENFIAGFLILWRRPFWIGDQVRSGSHEGTVHEINFRSTVLRTYDGLKVYIPNGQIFTNTVVNLTGFEERRSTVILGIDQNASPARAREIIIRALRDVEGVLTDPAPLVLFDSVSNFTNDIHVLFWTRPPTRLSEITTKSDVTERLFTALQEAGITFPYPIQTVQFSKTLESGQ